mgnify:CR=1 FL=1
MGIVQPGMPSSVRKALILLIVTMLMEIGRKLLDPSFAPVGLNVPLPVEVVSIIAFVSVFIAGIANGRRWVAILLVVVFVPGTLGAIWGTFAAVRLVLIIWDTLAAAVNIAVLALILGSPAREWFRKCKAARS